MSRSRARVEHDAGQVAARAMSDASPAAAPGTHVLEGAVRTERSLTDAEIAAYLMVCDTFDLPHQLVAAHEAELAAIGGEFDLGGEG